MRIGVGIFAGLLIAIVMSVLAALVGAQGDASDKEAVARANAWSLWAFFGSWVLFILWSWRRARSSRRVWGGMFLVLGLSALALPLAIAINTASYAGRQQDGTAVIAAGIITVASGFIGFFVGAVLLVIAAVLIRGDRGRTKRCPRCAERVLAAATVCRFCQYDFSGAELARA